MNNDQQQFRNEGRNVHLLRSEKDAIKKRILRTRAPEILHSVPSPWPFLYAGRMFVTVLALVVVGGGSLVYAAEYSSPGDALYRLELYVVEPVEKVLLFTPASRIEYSSNRIEERFRELRKASVEDVASLDVDVAKNNIIENVHTVLLNVSEESETKKNVDHLAKVSAILSAHENALAVSNQSVDDIKMLHKDVDATLVGEVSAYAEGKNDSELAEALQQEVSETAVLIEGDTATSTTEVAEHLDHVRQQVTDGDLKEALREAVSARVQALTEDYSAEAKDNDQ